MEEEIVAKPKRKKRSAKNRARTSATRSTTKRKVCAPPGKPERALMFLAKILKSLLKIVEKKINNIKSARLAKRMGDKKD